LESLKRWEVVTKLVEQLKVVITEKVIRINFATLTNLVNELNFNEDMIVNGLLKITDGLMSRKWKDDDLVSDMERMKKELDEAIIGLSSFDKYVTEIQSGRLEWTPVHNPQFWRENNTKCEEKSFAIIKNLINLLNSPNEVTVEVACYDIGEFARFHPDGKRIIQAHQGKRYLMEKMSHKNPLISRQALTAVQKLMVTNWEVLDKSNKGAIPGSDKSSASS